MHNFRSFHSGVMPTTMLLMVQISRKDAKLHYNPIAINNDRSEASSVRWNILSDA